jgi:heptosyltransferase I
MIEPTQRFLVIRLSSIGDIVHALPAVAALGETFPRAEIYWAVETRYASLLEGNPFVHQVIKLNTIGWRRKFVPAETPEDIARSILALREVCFDAAIDFQGLFKSGLIAWLSRSQARVGFAENWLREPAAGVYYSERVTPRGRRHVIELNMALVERLGARPPAPDRWQFPLPRVEANNRAIDQRLESLGAEEFIVISPGAGWKSKCWPPEHYAELIRRLARELQWKVLLTGSSEERDLIRGILERAESEKAYYIPSTLPQLIPLARRAKLFMGGDTGPVHMAAAVGRPVVAIFGTEDPLNTPERNGPFSANDIIVTPPETDHRRGARNHSRGAEDDSYLRGISVDSVLAAIRQRLARAYG